MSDWKEAAWAEVTRSMTSGDPDDRPMFQIPKPRKWWKFWAPLEFETVTGISRNDAICAQKAVGDGE